MSGSGPIGVILCVECFKSDIAVRGQRTPGTGSQESYMGVYLLVAFCIMILDMLELSRLLERRYVPVQLPQPLVQRRITRSNITDVALEMLHIDWIEANDGGIEANVCFSDVGTEIVGSSVFGKVSLGAVKGDKKGFDGFLISFLRSGDSQLVVKNFARRAFRFARRGNERT